MKKLVLASVAALTLSTPALAADFTGIRAEGRVGFDRFTTQVEVEDEELYGENEEDGLAFGAEVGFDLAMDDTSIFGVYGGIDFSKAETCDEVFGDDEACIEPRRNLAAGIRAGVKVSDNALGYFKGGYSNLRLRSSYDDGDEMESESVNFGGWHAGAGLEYAFGPNAYGKFEYVYTEYNNRNDEETGINVDAGRHQVLLGVGFRF